MINKILRKAHILHNIYIKNRFWTKKKSYSMDNEDLKIVDYFKDKEMGFYIDVGCFHPIHWNNTYLLFKKNWNGINIDISEFSIDLFKHMRPDDLNYNFAITNKSEKIKFYYQKQLSLLSTIEMGQAKKVFQGNIKEKIIQSYTLDTVLDMGKFKNKKIDFLNIDVEGADFKVLQGLSFKKYQPKLICIEIHNKDFKSDKSYKFLIGKGYELIWNGAFSFIFESKIK